MTEQEVIKAENDLKLSFKEFINEYNSSGNINFVDKDNGDFINVVLYSSYTEGYGTRLEGMYDEFMDYYYEKGLDKNNNFKIFIYSFKLSPSIGHTTDEEYKILTSSIFKAKKSKTNSLEKRKILARIKYQYEK